MKIGDPSGSLVKMSEGKYSKVEKTTIFDHAIPSQLTPQNHANKYLNLSPHTLFRLWKLLFTNELFEEIMFLSNLFARREKNDQ